MRDETDLPKRAVRNRLKASQELNSPIRVSHKLDIQICLRLGSNILRRQHRWAKEQRSDKKQPTTETSEHFSSLAKVFQNRADISSVKDW
jgi:hypothetical protein